MNISYDTHSVDLPNPNLGDKLRFTSQGIKRETPFGNIKVFKDSDWPVIETFIYEFFRLTETQKDDLIAAINAANGLEVTITDHHGAVRTGYIVTPVNEILTMKDACWYDATFEFMVNAIVNILGDCHDDITVDIPGVGDSDYSQTIGANEYYRIYAEDDTEMDAEDDDDLWIEAY